MDDIFTRVVVQGSNETDKVVNLQASVQLAKVIQDLVNNDILDLLVEHRESSVEFLEEGFTLLGKAENIQVFFNKEEEVSDFWGTEIKDIVSKNVGDEFSLSGNGTFRADE